MLRNNLMLDLQDNKEEELDKQLKILPDAILQFKLFRFLNTNDAVNLADASTLFKNSCRNEFFSRLLQHVAYGEQEQAEAILQRYPSLLLVKGNVTDYSFRHFKNITAFQYALWALDQHMWTMLLKYLPKGYAAEQFSELEEKGTDYGKHYDFSSLISALEIYKKKYGPKYEDSVDCWIKVVGSAQRNVPAHVANEYCYPNRNILTLPSFTEAYLPRQLYIGYNYNLYYTGVPTYWFPLDENSGLGFDFAVTTLRDVTRSPPCTWGAYGENRSLTAMNTLSKVRWEALNLLKKTLGLSESITLNRKIM